MPRVNVRVPDAEVTNVILPGKSSKGIQQRLSSYLHERLNDMGTVSKRGSVKIDMSVKMWNTSTDRPYEALLFPGIGFSRSYEE
ncbi:hypothetical protein Tco_1566668 [Tanacetum coccineum]